MLVEIRPAARLRGKNAIDLAPALAPALAAVVADGEVDLARLRITADWVQYRHSFRPPVALRPVAGGEPLELALDLRRAGDADATASAVAAVLRAHRTGGAAGRHVTLEEWAPTSRSLIWRFNALYWQHLRAWEEATGQGYESALPGGQSDAREDEPVRATIRGLFAVWDSLAERRALPEELYVLELGVGNGNQARSLARRVPRARRRTRRAATTAACTTSWATTPATSSSSPGPPWPRTPSTSAPSSSTPSTP